MSKSTKHQREEKRPPDAPAGEIGALHERVAALEAELAEARDARQRALADFLNYQKRAIVNEREAREDGAGRVLESLLGVADYLDLALKQNPDAAPAKAILDGVWLIREELHKVLQEHGVAPISPAPGDPADPARHDAIAHEPAEGVEPGAVTRVEQPGYEYMGRVLRPAKVCLAPDPTTDTIGDHDHPPVADQE